MAEEDGDAADSLADKELDLQGCIGYATGPHLGPQLAATLETQSLDAPDWAHYYPNYLGVLPLSWNYFMA